MPQLSLTLLGASAPIGVVAEATTAGVRVSITSDQVSFSDRRVLISAVFQFGMVFVLFTAFFGLSGVFHAHPQFWAIVLGLSIFAALVAAIQSRGTLSKRCSIPARLEISGGQLIIDEPSFDFQREGTRVRVAPLHMEYALTEIDSFSITSADDFDPVEGSLRIHLIGRVNEHHLKGRKADQLQWVCQWLSGSLRSARLRAQSKCPESQQSTTDSVSFVFGEDGLRTMQK